MFFKKLIAYKIKLKVNDNTEHACTTVIAEELLAIKATKGRSAFNVMPFLKDVLKKCTNKVTFVLSSGHDTGGF